MPRKYKTSYKSRRGVKRFQVSFNAPALAASVQEVCTKCGGKIEESPMMRGVCYSCYREIVENTALSLPKAVSWDEAMTELGKDFNRRYYGNQNGLPEWGKR